MLAVLRITKTETIPSRVRVFFASLILAYCLLFTDQNSKKSAINVGGVLRNQSSLKKFCSSDHSATPLCISTFKTLLLWFIVTSKSLNSKILLSYVYTMILQNILPVLAGHLSAVI
mgnify:FL=1